MERAQYRLPVAIKTASPALVTYDQCQMQEIKQHLAKIFFLLGLSEKQVPSNDSDGGSMSELDLLIGCIQKSHGNLTADFIVSGFEAYCSDALRDYGAPTECYFFSYHFFSRVMRAYFEYMKATGKAVASFDKQRQAQTALGQKQIAYKPAPVDWSEFLTYKHKSTLTIPVQLYDYMVGQGKIGADDYKAEVDWVVRLMAAKIEGVFRKPNKEKREQIEQLSPESPLVIIEAKKRFMLNYINSQ